MDLETNVIYCGDCLSKLKEIPDESVDLIYIDPPFSSNRNYTAFWQEQEKRHFEDRFKNVRAYLGHMKPRIEELYRALKPMGSFYYHCDWHASHYIKVLLDSDQLFSFANFQGEIIWQRTSAHPSARRLANTHDSLFFYTKSNQFTWNPVFQELGEHYIKTHYIYHDKRGRYRATDLTGAGISSGASGLSWRGIDPKTKGRHWAYVPDTLNDFDRQGLIHWPKSGWPAKKVYWEDTKKGKPIHSIWVDIPPINSQAKERLGYPTQKPEALLERIIRASSNEGDIVLDAFCGCGTTLVVAEREKRKWIGIDISPTACRVMARRLEGNFYMKEGRDFCIRDLPKTIEELRQYPPFEFQNWAINAIGGVPSRVKVKDGGIDGKLYPIEDIQKEKTEGIDLFGEIDRYIPIQVKRTDQVGQPDIDNFETAMKRDKRNSGIFVGFDFSRDAQKEIRRAEREEGLEIQPITVAEIVERQMDKELL